MPDLDSPHRIPVGEVSSAHGIRGLLKVRVYNDASDVLASLEHVDLRYPDDRIERRTVLRATPHHRGVWLVMLEGVTDRSTAETLAGCRIVVDEDHLPHLEPGEFYHHEIVGFAVETTAGEPVGVITATMSTGLNDVWVVRDGDREHLIPVIADVVALIDRAARRVVIVPIDGLLE